MLHGESYKHAPRETLPATRVNVVGPAARPVRAALRAKAFERLLPVSVTIELTKRCNLHCRHCYVSGSAPGLPLQRLNRLMAELVQAGCIWVVLTGGEVAMRSDWLEIARSAKRHGLIVSVLTNGTLMSEQELDELVALGPARVSVSVYAGEPARHDAITGQLGSFVRSVAVLKYLVDAGVRCRLSCTLMDLNLDQYPEVIGIAQSLGCDYQFDPTVGPRSNGDLDVTERRVPVDRLREFFLDEGILRASREGAAIEGPACPEPREMRNCAAGFTTAFVDASGDVYPCMGFPPAFGSIAERPFVEVWRGPVASEHRHKMLAPLSGCDGCAVTAFCAGRCPRLALCEGGDMSGPYGRACELAALTRELNGLLHRPHSRGIG